MPTNKKLLIFDFDGTLFDSISALSKAEVNAVNEMGWKPITEEYARGTIGLSLSTIYVDLCGDKTLSKLEEFKDRFNNYFFGKVHEVGFFPGIVPMLQTLKDKGFILAIATGKGRPSLERLDKILNFSQYFETTIVPEESAPKPNPLMVFKLLEQFGVKPEDAVVIGDSEHDLKMAANAGVPSIGVTFGASDRKTLETFSPIAIVDSVTELEKKLLSL